MAFRWRAVDGPLIVVFGSFLSSSLIKLKKQQQKKRCQSWTSSGKTFWICACSWNCIMGQKIKHFNDSGGSSHVRTKYMATCNFPGGGLRPLPPLPLCLRPYQSFKHFEFKIVRHFRDFLYQRVLGHMYCRAWSIHKLSANYISWRQRQRQHDPFYNVRSKRPLTSIPATCCFKIWGRMWWPWRKKMYMTH